MDVLLRQLYQDRASDEDTLAILVLEKEQSPLSITDGFDVIILLINSQQDIDWEVKHYEVAGKCVAFHSLSQVMMHHTLIVGNQRRLIDWLVNGKIVFDRNEFLTGVKERIESFPPGDRSKKMTIQFTKMLRRFEEGKVLFYNGHYFDAFSNMMHALHHLARLSVIHHGFYPEVTVWEQVRHIEPQTYKLYQELLNSEETLEKRIELLILATELAIHSKTEIGSEHFLSLISIDVSSIAEFMGHQEVEDYRIDLELLVRHLVEKGFLCYKRKETKVEGIEKILYLKKNNKSY
ncbi:nucleotidyltransferase-like protein [Halalkalibacter nanhaiisediminis]|uniref:Nucleotidyltransferase-like protein n=1 Tax=Halalkalibacter nanhaiisediminis TaxID=688079 RepID=A0A562Q7F8_9BACI|nr:nucleotidyltransferase-like protein [Halalkalibacter nanhaiisediminis]TWI52648.1 nucleotidyltransferase-like protein [Halalkalibacter nanhaiisediminis]